MGLNWYGRRLPSFPGSPKKTRSVSMGRIGLARAWRNSRVASFVSGTVREVVFLVSRSLTTRRSRSIWLLRRVEISEDRIPVPGRYALSSPAWGWSEHQRLPEDVDALPGSVAGHDLGRGPVAECSEQGCGSVLCP